MLRGTAGVLAGVLFLLMAAENRDIPEVRADDVSQMQDEYEALEQKNQEYEEQLSQFAEERQEELAYQQTLGQQISVLESQIKLKEEEQRQLEADIAVKQEEIAQKEEDIEENYNLFKKRLRAMYMAGEASALDVLLSSNSISDFLANIVYVRRVSEHDNQLIQTLEAEKQELSDMMAGLEKDLAAAEKTRKDMAAKQVEMSEAYQKTTASINAIKKQEQEFAENQEEIQRQMDALEAEIAHAIEEAKRQNMQSIDYSGDGFAWPLPNYSMITSLFEMRWGQMHKGIDISGSGVHGEPIVASNHGTVITAQTTYIPGYSYGKYVMIDHGGGYVTLYGHCSEVLVTVGQEVSKGDVIAKVGNTGNSFGAHLHFEVRVDGVAQNPLNYVSYGS